MSLSVKVGSFNIDTAKTVGQTIAIAGLGFQPKLVLFFWGGSAGVGDSLASGTMSSGFGAATDSTHRFCNNIMSEDNVSGSMNYYSQSITDFMRAYTTDDAIDGILDFASMDADGFTMTVDDQFTIAYRVSWIALGGADLTNVFLGQITSTATPSVITGIGFKPDAIILAQSNRSNNSGYQGIYQGIGMASDPTKQFTTWLYASDNAATTDGVGYGIHGQMMGKTANHWTLTSFDADGFTMTGGSANILMNCICLKGGKYDAGSITTRTDGNDIAVSNGFQPKGILFLSANRAESTSDTTTPDIKLSIGAATSISNRACAAISDEAGLTTTETAYSNYDSAVYSHIKDDASVGLMDIKSIDPSGFTCVMDTVEAAAGCWVGYLAFGDTPAVSVPRKPLLGVGI
jgi:hypothetical protein